MSGCGKCGTEVPDAVRDCPICGTHHGFPNVKSAASEAAELQGRWEAARLDARGRGCDAQVQALEDALSAVHAVVNVDVGFLHRLLTNEHTLYSAYGKQVAAGVRAAASSEHDRQRTSVEGLLFGSWGNELCYAALSLDGRGLTSYGEISLELRDAAIDDRASLLEENSFDFVRRHRLVPGDPLPRGYRAPWADRARLAVSKLASSVHEATTANDHARLLLAANATRTTDDFVEVHVFGTFNQGAVAGVQVIGDAENAADQVLLQAAKAKAAKLGLRWT